MTSLRVHHDDLARFIAGAFATKGMSAADATVVADVLVWANLRGGDGHGVARLPRYLEMIDRNEMDPRGRPHMALDAQNFFILDAARAAGPIAMMEAVAAATERAKAGGACIILGAAYPFMPYHGAKVASLPTAPLVMGVPTARHGPVVLDMASSIIAMGKIHQARLRNETLGEGLALDADGKPTTEPKKAAM